MAAEVSDIEFNMPSRSLLQALSSGRLHEKSSLMQCLRSSAFSEDQRLVDAVHLYCSQKLLQAPELDPQTRFALLNRYNELTGKLARLLYSRDRFSSSLELGILRLAISLPTDEQGMAFERFWFAQDLHVQPEYYRPDWQQESLGQALIAHRPNQNHGIDSFYPPEGIFRGLTLLLDSVQLSEQEISLSFVAIDHKHNKQYSLGENLYSLADGAGPAYLLLLEHAELDSISWQGLFNAVKVDQRFGIYLLEPFDANKIPVLMIHGLNSNPLIWSHLSWMIFSDPMLSQKFQVWHAFYPSGPPPFYNAMRIRAAADHLVATLSHDKQSLAATNMVVVGHSMGGLIARMFATDSGMALWDRTFSQSPEALAETVSNMQEIRDIFIFSPRPYVRTLVLMDTPHRGSNLARSTVGSLASAFVNLPGQFTGLFTQSGRRLLAYVRSEMSPYLAEGGPNSIEVLAPGHPLMDELSRLPFAPGVKVFSIVGSQGELHCSEKDCETISDGVVEYFSASLKDAEVQIIVQSAHDSYRNSDALALTKEALLATWRSVMEK
ncbi:alpha/beta hydrolase [Aliiglaciecola sp. CAU 1673]|uniref:esterase/lipase family protein n=1 Tax=Aliiglaciecola sp. CAU 1673 TaxID=3032595 RepID=UPI0023DB256A|nr:alpha/beta hydrolase [Aliiglaciecola sp. CAU 1673]MDF2179457.1 alpha/beta hydrolase [Aliiglaciecola sp. CAU 1673]